MDDSETEREEQRPAPTKKKCLFDDSFVGKVCACITCVCFIFESVFFSEMFSISF